MRLINQRGVVSTGGVGMHVSRRRSGRSQLHQSPSRTIKKTVGCAQRIILFMAIVCRAQGREVRGWFSTVYLVVTSMVLL